MNKVRQALLGLLESLRKLVAPQLPEPRRGAKTEKELERWANEGGH